MPDARKHMSTSLLAVEPGARLAEVAQRMVERDVGAVLVMDGGRLAGIMTERDVLRAVAAGIGEATSVGTCMTREPETIAPDESINHAAVLMLHGGFRHLPVLEGDQVVGMLSIRDLMRVTIEDHAPRGV
jgi:CBS domain-containing protein